LVVGEKQNFDDDDDDQKQQRFTRSFLNIIGCSCSLSPELFIYGSMMQAEEAYDEADEDVIVEGFSTHAIIDGDVIFGGSHAIDDPLQWKDIPGSNSATSPTLLSEVFVKMQPVLIGSRLSSDKTYFKAIRRSDHVVMSTTISIDRRPNCGVDYKATIMSFRFKEEFWNTDAPRQVMDILIQCYSLNSKIRELWVTNADAKRRKFLKDYGFQFDGIKDYFILI
jgi:hypothetical protein